ANTGTVGAKTNRSPAGWSGPGPPTGCFGAPSSTPPRKVGRREAAVRPRSRQSSPAVIQAADVIGRLGLGYSGRQFRPSMRAIDYEAARSEFRATRPQEARSSPPARRGDGPRLFGDAA